MTNEEAPQGQNENSPVTESTVTHGEQEQPSEPASATDAAMKFLQELKGSGEDVITKPLSKKRAAEIASKLPGGPYGPGVVYNARAKLLEKGGTAHDLPTGAGGKVIVPDLDDILRGAKGVGGGEGEQAPAGDANAGNGPDIPAPGGEPKPEKQFEPVPIETIQTIADAILEGVAGMIRDSKRTVSEKNVKALQSVYNATLEAYNASIPKAALIPICIIFSLVVFALPFAPEIKDKIKKMTGKAELPPAEETTPEN